MTSKYHVRVRVRVKVRVRVRVFTLTSKYHEPLATPCVARTIR